MSMVPLTRKERGVIKTLARAEVADQREAGTYLKRVAITGAIVDMRQASEATLQHLLFEHCTLIADHSVTAGYTLRLADNIMWDCEFRECEFIFDGRKVSEGDWRWQVLPAGKPRAEGA